MFDRWRDLDPSQRRLLGVLGSLVVAVALVVGVVAFTGSDSKVALRTDQSSPSSSTASSAVTVTSVLGDPSTSTSTSTSTSGSTSGSSTTLKGSTATTKASGSGGTSGTTATSRATGSTGTTAGTTPTTTGTTATTSDAACNPGGGGSDANQIANLFCRYRADHGLAKMTRNSALDQVAQTWAQKMADTAASGVAPNTALQHNINGNGPTYSGPTYPGGYSAAVKADCSTCTGWAENVAYDTSASGAWNGWLQSPPHLADISDGHAGEYGIGVASGGGFLWFVQDFGRYPQ